MMAATSDKQKTAADAIALSGGLWRVLPHTLAEIASGKRWKPYRHLVHLSTVIVREIVKGNGRVIINMPPRYGKSEFVSHWLPTWFLENWPHRHVLLCAHGAELAAGFGRVVRNEFTGNSVLSTKLREDSSAANRWNTPQGGGMFTGGVGTGITGKGGHLLILDDPYPTWAEAQSRRYRERVTDWFWGTFYQRREPGATIIVLHHRMHAEDLTHHLVNSPNGADWKVVTLPALAEEGDALGRDVGEPLCPERFSADEVRATMQASGERVWLSMHQQRPQVVGMGSLYHRFSAENIDKSISVDRERPLHLAFDFNRTPNMHAIIGQYDKARDVFTVVDELTKSRDLYGTMKEFSEWMKLNYGGKATKIVIFGDAAGNTKNTQTGAEDYEVILSCLKNYGFMDIQLCVPKSNPPIVGRVTAFNDALRDISGKVHYKVHPRCATLLRDFRDMMEDEDGKPDESNKQLGHSTSAEGYRVHYLRPIVTATKRGGGQFGFGSMS